MSKSVSYSDHFKISDSLKKCSLISKFEFNQEFAILKINVY